MEPDTGREERNHDHERPHTGADTSAAEASLKAKLSRKRTKTGCLTCRKRRIKCGEERPVCRNCIKSKRHCEGYSPRVVFRPPTFEYEPIPNNGGAHIIFQAGPVSDPTTTLAGVRSLASDPSPYTQLRPRLVDPQLTASDGRLPQYLAGNVHRYQPSISSPLTASEQQQSPGQDQSFHISATMPEYSEPRFESCAAHVQLNPTYADSATHIDGVSNTMSQHSQSPAAAGSFFANSVAPIDAHMKPIRSPVNHSASMLGQNTRAVPSNREFHTPTNQQWTMPNQNLMFAGDHDFVVPTPLSSHSSGSISHSHQSSLTSPQPWPPETYMPRPELMQPIDYNFPHTNHAYRQPVPTATSSSHVFNHPAPEYYDHEQHHYSSLSPANMLNAAAVEAQDDDYYDIGSDEEIDFDTSAVSTNGYQRQRTLSKILALNQISTRELQVRRYDTFIYEGILDHYRVEEVANPLRNPATARVFAHFISATGPSLSIFERHPRNTSVLFTEGTVPLSQQGLWTYTMPMAALRNQGLLHAMLAMASLHIARLQGASVTPSMQHYAWSLKRIHKAVGNPNSRLKLTTMAASMLLGFYEVMTADHMKWNLHLAGSKQLFVETDFAGMTREVRRMKLEKAARLFHHGEQNRHSPEEPFSRDDLLDQIPDIDERIVSQFLGREVRYDDYGRIESQYPGIPSSVDLNKFEILKDLYWWYCKQDVYQSVVSGNNLLMDFSRWSNCPPRAPMGKVDAVYGTFDHLVLLLGRIADFGARDRVRKLKQMELNGGQWRPAPGMNIPRPPPMQTPSPPASSQPMPAFYGMAPPPRSNVQMPSSYTPMHDNMPRQHQNTNTPETMDYDLQGSLNAALEEYGRIRAALHAFASSLGEAFAPLTSEYQAPLETAFGPALFYRSYDIGCLWSIYNMAVIIAIRSHPHMPPASHMAAAVAAHETAFFANEIGRIAAGIVPGPPDQPLNPSLGATLCESCMPSFFAAVQYQDARQRHETVTRIFSIAKRTGWGSAELIANGCETAWVKAAAMGRGPPYQRIARQYNSDDPRLNGSWEHLDPNAMPDMRDERDRRLVKVNENARLNWAIGVMGIEDDVESTSTPGGLGKSMR